MQRDEARQYVLELYQHLLRHTPAEAERERWVDLLTDGLSAEAAFRAFIGCREYQDLNRIRPGFPDGHFHSPVVDPTTVEEYVRRARDAAGQGIAGVDVPASAMAAFWTQHAAVIARTPFTDGPVPDRRYHFDNPVFAYGDAIMLRAMLEAARPGRVIEVGSGFSTACMLDTADEFGLEALKLTCIEPNPRRLRELLRPDDDRCLLVVERPVQSVAVDQFAVLEENDILFVDSTHVLKTGSDVHYVLFEILPSLHRGVIVHFHDIHFPFEYPDDWIFTRNFSWNESYALRAFLMYNAAFEMVFWNGFFAATFPDLVRTTIPAFLRNPGGSLWLRRR